MEKQVPVALFSAFASVPASPTFSSRMSPPKPTSTADRLASGARIALFGVAVNTVLATVKISAGMIGHSYALIADGIESTLDIFSSLLIWGGLMLAARPPDATHPYGHGKAEPIASVGVALIVMAAAVALAAESIHEILTPHHAPAWWTLVILVAVVIVKELLFRRVLKVSEHIESSAVKTDAWHHRSDAITSGAAFIGISVALIGGPGYEPADDWAALIACLLIGWNGWTLLLPAVNETMDVAPPEPIISAIREIAAGVAHVERIDKCTVRKMGLDFFVDLHIEVDGDLTVRQGHEIAHQVRDAIRSANPAIVDVLIHIEPAGEGEGD